MKRPFSIVHVVARLGATGPTRSLAALVKYGNRSGRQWSHTVLVLETGVAPSAVLWLRREGAKLLVCPYAGERDVVLGCADVVIVHFWNCPSIVAFLAQSINDSPVAPRVVWVHTLGAHPPQILAPAVVESTDDLWLSTAATRSVPALRDRDPIRTAMVPGLVDPDRLVEHRPVSHHGTVVGYVGTINRQKLHPRFVELCAAIARKASSDIRFTVVGAGGDEQEIRDFAAEIGIADRFTVAGHIDNIAAVLSRFDMFGYPLSATTYASSDLSVQEAMWVGLPPVVLDVGGLASMIRSGETGLVVSSDDDYVNGVCLLADDPSLRKRLGQNAQEHAKENFDPMRSVERVADRLAFAIDEHPRDREHGDGTALFGLTPAQWFVSSLGSHGDPFRRSLADERSGEEALADHIAASDEMLVRGEGGLFHWCNAYPDDERFRRWSAIAIAASGRTKTARQR